MHARLLVYFGWLATFTLALFLSGGCSSVSRTTIDFDYYRTAPKKLPASAMTYGVQISGVNSINSKIDPILQIPSKQQASFANADLRVRLEVSPYRSSAQQVRRGVVNYIEDGKKVPANVYQAVWDVEGGSVLTVVDRSGREIDRYDLPSTKTLYYGNWNDPATTYHGGSKLLEEQGSDQNYHSPEQLNAALSQYGPEIQDQLQLYYEYIGLNAAKKFRKDYVSENQPGSTVYFEDTKLPRLAGIRAEVTAQADDPALIQRSIAELDTLKGSTVEGKALTGDQQAAILQNIASLQLIAKQYDAARLSSAQAAQIAPLAAKEHEYFLEQIKFFERAK